MDALPIALSAVCERVDSVRVDRVQDARIRRLAFQKKIGAGLTPSEFAERVKDLSVRHVGLTESVAMIADALGFELSRITDEIQPRVAEQAVESSFLRVEAGQVCGIVQDGVGYVGADAAIVLHMEAYLGAHETFDSVTIEGSPRLCVKAAGGYHGDIATAAIAVNTIPRVLGAAPGLHTMRSLALPSFAGGR
jgi:4-hydroxy-tetrahydrodipicolinate reductase